MSLSVLQISLFQDLIDQIIEFLPNLVYAGLTLIIGYVVGRSLGGVIDSLLSRLNFNKRFEETDVGRGIKTAGYTFSGLIAVAAKLFIYVLTIIVALGFLDLPVVDQLISLTTIYLPRIISAGVLFLVGIIVVDWMMRILGGVLEETKILGVRWVTLGIKYLLYVVLILISLDIAQIAATVTEIVAQSILFTLVLGAGLTFALMVGLGFREEAKVLFSSDLEFLEKGQKIKVDDVEGEITRISMLTVELDVGDGRKILLPKRKLLEEGFELR
jgi:hypothetical protein